MRYFNLALSALIISINGISVSHARVGAVDVVKETLNDFYGDMRSKYPRVTTPIDVEGNAEISTENAAEFIAKALIAKGDAPQADDLFRRYYDPYANIHYLNPYRKAAILYEEKDIKNGFNFSVLTPKHIVEPETDEAEDGFTDINYEINEAWRVVLKELVKSPVTRPSIIRTEVFHEPNNSIRSFKKHQNVPYCSKTREFKRRQDVWKSNWGQQRVQKRRDIHLNRAKKTLGLHESYEKIRKHLLHSSLYFEKSEYRSS